jgi:3-dehydroquinate synthase
MKTKGVLSTLQTKNYPIYFDEHFSFLKKWLSGSKHSKYFILADDNTINHCFPILANSHPKLKSAHIIAINPGEASKDLSIAQQIWTVLTENEADKKALLINLGGGVVSDLGGFCAALYKRGIDFVNIPTTLLAMADASVGGKTGIDFLNYKNHIGTIQEPKALFIHPAFLHTLPVRHLKNGMAEIIKIACLQDKALWQNLVNHDTIDLKYIIYKSIELKHAIVKKDLKDEGIRQSLNFGHTVGHAIEGALMGTKKEVLHGEAIAAGMIVESIIAVEKKLLDETTLNELIVLLFQLYPKINLNKLETNKVLDHIKQDKKNTKDKINLALACKGFKFKTNVAVSIAEIKNVLAVYEAI